MNQINRSSRTPNKTQDIHSLIATLDENDADQRRLRDLIRRFHFGRWPLLRCLGMRSENGKIIEIAQWLRSSDSRRFTITWESDGSGLCWRPLRRAPSAAQTCNTLLSR